MAPATENWTAVGRVGGATGFERLFVAEYARVVAIANRVLADAHEAEDVAQEVFVAFHRRYSADAAFAAAWLHAAAAHTALNVLRGKRRRFNRETADARADVRAREGIETSLDPLGALERAEQRREVRRALARLPERQATALVLRYSGLSYAEVAGALGVPADQVGSMLRRAEAKLRKEMPHDTPQ